FWMVAVSSGLIGPTCSRTEAPSSVTVCARSVWFETVISIGPAPALPGEIVTLFGWITPVSCSGTGARVLLGKSPPPQPTIVAAVAPTARNATARILRVMPLPPSLAGETLTEPHRSARRKQVVELRLYAASHFLADSLHERHVIRVVWAVGRDV